MRRLGLLILTLLALIWPVCLLASDVSSQQALTMPAALAIMSVLGTIMVALIKLTPAKPQQPINIAVTWPERVPEHHHPEYMLRPECERVHEALGHEIRDAKKVNP